jgi:thiol-disulfide isomerase/thioredoxin
MWVKVSLLLILLMTLLSFGVNSVVGKTKAPDFILVDIDGNSFSLSDCPAKVVLIDFFGTYCTPCIQVIPALRNLYSEYSRDQLEIISISSSDSDAVLRDFVQDPVHIMTWVVASDLSGQIASKYGIQYIPTLFIIDTERSIQHKHIGVTAEATLRSEINSVLSGGDNGDSNGDSDTASPGPPIELIAIIGGVAIVFLVGIVVAGQMLGWSKPAKRRRRPKR